MKRVLAFLLACYVIALTLDPCVDNEVNCNSGGILVKETGTTDHSSDHRDMCSPFCTCNCCSVTMEVASVLLLPATPVVYSTLSYYFETHPVSSFLPSVWEPPKA